MGIIMRRIFRIIEGIIRYWWVIAIAVIVLCLVGCKTTYVPVETIKTETERVVDIQRDSIYVLDSIYVREAHDTVYITKWRTEYKEALRIDTFNIAKVDSITTIIEVEKRLTKWQQTKMDVGAGVMWAVPILIAVGLFLLYRKLKK